jgi:hypothetical protein
MPSAPEAGPEPVPLRGLENPKTKAAEDVIIYNAGFV